MAKSAKTAEEVIEHIGLLTNEVPRNFIYVEDANLMRRFTSIFISPLLVKMKNLIIVETDSSFLLVKTKPSMWGFQKIDDKVKTPVIINKSDIQSVVAEHGVVNKLVNITLKDDTVLKYQTAKKIGGLKWHQENFSIFFDKYCAQ